MVLGEFDPSSNLRFQFSPDLAQLEEYRSSLKSVRGLFGNLVGGHGSLGSIENLEPELLDIRIGCHIVRHGFILGVVAFELLPVVSIRNCIVNAMKRRGGSGSATNLLELIHQVRGVELDLIIGGMETALNNLVHNMVVT